MYDFTVTPEVRKQIAALPDEACPYLDELITFLELTPWNGRSSSDKDPDANMRTQAFGPMARAWPGTSSSSTPARSPRSGCCGWTGHDLPLDNRTAPPEDTRNVLPRGRPGSRGPLETLAASGVADDEGGLADRHGPDHRVFGTYVGYD